VLLLMGASLLVAVVAGTAISDRIYRDYVVKGATESYIYTYSEGTSEGGIFYTREGPWAKSWEGAKAGGWFGAGYGVSVGDTNYQGGLTSVGYGREKGNAQLAVVEETGFVGLALYSVLLLALFARLILAHVREKDPDIKVALGIITGALAGLTAMSVFEAWWVSPGAPESACFWSLVGVGLGLADPSVSATTKLSMASGMPSQIFGPAELLSQRRARG
jgi:O-antigen ligase